MLPYAAEPLLPGRLWAGPCPCGTSRSATLRHCALLLERGVRVFLDLRTPDERQSGTVYEPLLRQAALECKALVRCERLPFPPAATPCPQTLKDALSGLSQEWAAGHAVYVHAVDLDDRVLLVAACAAHLLRRIPEARQLAEGLTPAQRAYVEGFTA